ncbi:MAG: hypothetical protein EOP77_03020 [Variovorax sp.]|nr:MAG: hypothetical protein EOP77_03020 [Variovorax sp.]
MNEAELDKSVARLMERVDYYLHCELDDEYDHEQPETARSVLEAALRSELLRASAIGLLSTVGSPSHTLPGSGGD